ncbi:MAG: oxidoreductase, partial [Burkholderiales bacterium]|nr:oxidoreductase [Burkholderiales bacterium]
LTLGDGTSIPFDRLALATGSTPRLPRIEGTELAGVFTLRHAEDARRLREQLAAAASVTVLGGGFIGLEIAASARALGKAVTLLESAPRLLERSVSAEIAEHVLQTHRGAGIDLRLAVAAEGFEVEGGRLAAISVDGRREPVELLVMGIGAAPDTALAEAAGLECDNGIVVDACLRSSDPAILAVGDCANFPQTPGGRRLRLESVQNAGDQARTAVATLLGREEPYRALPWFWSEQGGLRLQMAGLMPAGGEIHRRPGATPASFSLFHYSGARLACVESVNAPMDHLMSRKLLEAGKSPAPDVVCDPKTALKALL